MLDEKEIDCEIARLEYMESSYPNYAKLADLYIIRNQINKNYVDDIEYENEYSYSPAVECVIGSYGGNEFLQAVEGKPSAEIWSIMDELMDTLKVVNPKAYRSIMSKIYET